MIFWSSPPRARGQKLKKYKKIIIEVGLAAPEQVRVDYRMEVDTRKHDNSLSFPALQSEYHYTKDRSLLAAELAGLEAEEGKQRSGR